MAKPNNIKSGKSFGKKELLIIVLALFLLLMGLAGLVMQKKNTAPSTKILDNRTADEISETDSDGDGIPDWRELLLGTNPLAFDTNSDGVGDDSVLAVTENTLGILELQRLRAQYPEASDAELAQLQQNQSLESGQTITDQVAQDVYLKTQILEKLGELTPELEQEIVNGYVEGLIYNHSYPLRSETDFIILDEYDPNREQSYIELVLEVTSVNFIETDPLLIFENYTTNRDAAFLKKGIDVSLSEVIEMIGKLESIEIPSRYVSQHLLLTNALVRVAVDLAGIRNYEEDALPGYAALLRYQANIVTYANELQWYITNIETAL